MKSRNAVRPVEDYHWNTLSVERMRELFAQHGFEGQVVHIGSFLRWATGCDQTHNPNAYTFLLHRQPADLCSLPPRGQRS